MNTNVKDEILLRADIVDLISEVVQLKKRGANYIGLCPFHHEKTPSFTVSREKGIYKCFGCGKAGNIFSFMMDYYQMTFKDALKELAKKYNIEYTESHKKEDSEAVTRREMILNALDAAEGYFQNHLRDKGEKALKFFYKRGFSNATIEKFGLGSSPEAWNDLQGFLNSMNYPNEILIAAGLLIKKENQEKYWDRFRERAMFPIYSRFGRVIAFGARDLRDNVPADSPKYLNSPQTEVYDKSTALYGLFQAKNEIRNKKYCILVEGYADVISLHEAGFSTAIASCGTSLTTGQLEIIKQFTDKIYLSYDADAAGQHAIAKAIDLALPFGFDLHAVKMKDGEDPDSIIKKYGKQTYSDCLASAISFIDFKYRYAKANGAYESEKDKADFTREIMRNIISIPDSLQQEFYINKLCSIVNISINELDKLKIEAENAYNQEKIRQFSGSSYDISTKNGKPQSEIYSIESGIIDQTKPSTAEEIRNRYMEYLYGILVSYTDKFAEFCKKFDIENKYFKTEKEKRVLAELKVMSQKGQDIQHAFEDLDENHDDDILGFLSGIYLKRENIIGSSLNREDVGNPKLDTDSMEHVLRDLNETCISLDICNTEEVYNGLMNELQALKNEDETHVREILSQLHEQINRISELKDAFEKLEMEY